MRPIVHSKKHYVQNSIATILASAKLDLDLIEAVNVTAANAVHEVTEGATVKAIYIEQWLRAGEVSPGSVIVCLVKVPGNGTGFSTASLAALGNADNKKNILFVSQGLINDQDADAIPFMRGWYKIPKSKQRFGLGDKLILQVFAQGAIDVHICGFATYKEYN